MKQAVSQGLLQKIPSLPSRAGKVAAAVSGGCDSVALLLLLLQLASIKKFQLCVFHVDHSLRQESGEDMLWVRQLCDKLGVEFFSRRINAPADMAEKKAGVEAWAREVRYKAFAEMAMIAGVDVVATGHNADDQLETMLMRLFSGTSLQGFCAIRAESQQTKTGPILWRPLLRISRHELEEFLLASEQHWLHDRTNDDDDFLRNAVRHNICSQIRRFFPAAAEKTGQLLMDLDQVQRYLADQGEEYLLNNLRGEELRLFPLPEILRREVVRQWLIRLKLGRSISRSLIERVVDLWSSRHTGRSTDYRRFRFVRKKNALVFERISL